MTRTGRAVLVAAVTVAAILAAVTAASAETVTYTFPEDTNLQPFYRWTVPAGVCLATFDLYGAEGSGGVGGAHVTSTIAVTTGASYDVYVGDSGVVGKGGYNGGGGASAPGVGGGGATDVRDGPALRDRLLVAGGGGGDGGTWRSGDIGGIGGVGALIGQDGAQSHHRTAKRPQDARRQGQADEARRGPVLDPRAQDQDGQVNLSRTIRKRLAALSSRRLKRLKIVATAKVGGKTTKFSLGATRKR